MVDRKDFKALDTGVLEHDADQHGDVREPAQHSPSDVNARGQRVRATLKARLGEDVYSSWFNSLEFQR